jgi:DNA-binding winged helix-turn-helix (wHTH) protein
MEIRLLGLVEASHDGYALPLGGAKPRGLLAMLAFRANTPVSADRLIEGLWGERPPAAATKVVQVLVSQLRKQLAGADAEVVPRGRGYRETRYFDRFSAPPEEITDARVWAGLHFRTADVQVQKLGMNVAEHFQPVGQG